MLEAPVWRRWLAAAVCGIAAAGAEPGVRFAGYTSPAGDSYIEVVVTDENNVVHTCPRGESATLWPQYNLASVLVPGLSPLAYANRTGADGEYNPDVDWLDPLVSALSGSNGLPEWWNKLGGGGTTTGPRAYRLRPTDNDDGPVDSLLATGLFIPEVELDGDYWWPTVKDPAVRSADTSPDGFEPNDVHKNRMGALDDTECRSHQRPSVADFENGEAENRPVFADLEVVQDVLLRSVGADTDGKDNIFEANVDVPVEVESEKECHRSTSKTSSFKNRLGNLTGYKRVGYAPTGAVNYRLYKEANGAAAGFLRNLPLGAQRIEDGSVNPQTDGDSVTFRARTVQNMKRYPGMVPLVAPWGPAAAPHQKPGRPFFEYAVKRCPGQDQVGDGSGDKCCLVIEGDGDMAELSDDSAGGASTTAAPGTDSPEAVGALAAAMQVTVDIPSTLTEVEGNDEYRLRWNQLSAHASFSRVVPDIGSMHLPNPWLFTDQLTYKATDFNSDYKYQDDLTNIWRNTTINGYVYNNAAMVLPVNKYAYLGSPDSLRPSDSPKPENTKNRMSPKCRYQRSSGAREREVMVYLEHFYVALAGEDEVHQLNKKWNQVPSNFTTGNMKVQPGVNSQGPWCVGNDCRNTEHAPGETVRPIYDQGRPFALETHFEPTKGNSEKYIKYPTSRLPLWFGGGHSSGYDRYQPGGCNIFRNTRCNPSATDDDRNEVNGEFGPYAGNVPCYGCYRNAAHQFENIIAAMVKRYGYSVKDNMHFGCQNDAKGMGSLNYNDDYWFPGSYLNRKRYFLTNGYYKQGVCHSEKFRVVVWDIDSTFKARRVASPGGAGTEDRGYRVNRTADQMVHLMRLHTGAAPVNRSETQMAFTNYRPVRSMFAKNTGSDNQDRDWSVETMCFGEPEDGGPGSEVCANNACGSGARWCHQRTGADIKTDLDWDAPWQQLPIRGTSDGTFRNNFWQSVCWIDPFAPGSIFGTDSTPGVRNDADYGPGGSGTVGYGNGVNSGGRDASKDGVGHPNTYPEKGQTDGKIGRNDRITSYPGLYFRSFTAGSLFPGNSMDIVDTSKEAFYDRGGMTSHNKQSGDERSKDRSAYTVRSPGQEHPLRYFSGWYAGQTDIYSEKQNYYGGNGGNDACTDPAHNNINFAHGGETESWNSRARLNICQRPIEGMATHTCADQSNRTFFSVSDFGQRRKFGEAWDMRYMFSKSALNQPFESRATMGSIADPDVTRFDKKEDPANLQQDWRYEGPIGKAQDQKRTNGTYWLPQKMPKVPYWDTDNFWDTPAGYDDAYNRHCPYREYIMAKAVLYMPFHRDAGNFKTFDPAYSGVGNKDQAKFWGKPYWATGAGGAMGCHSPANPPWAFPGVVLNERYGPNLNDHQCPHEYTAATHQDMNDDCKWAAWAPNVIERWDFERSSSPDAIGSSQNYWKPQPIFKNTFNPGLGLGADADGHYRGPPWPEWSFEMLHGWQTQTHMGRVNWGSHYASERKFLDDPHTNNNPHLTNDGGAKWSAKHTEGPYPASGKNDGLLECPSSMLERSFFWHQNIMQYSMLKRADICLGKEEVDESGLDRNGVAEYRDTWSWCVDPANLATDLCVRIATDICDGAGDACVQEVEGYCSSILSDSRTLAGDEQEYEESAGATGGRVTEASARNFCKCNGRGSTGVPADIFGPGARPELIPAYCVCRSLARTSRVVVGPNSLFATPESNFQAPAFLNFSRADEDTFPFCRCAHPDDAEGPRQCLVRRVCKRGLLGNDNNPLGSLNTHLDAGNIGPDGIYRVDDGSGNVKSVDGAVRFDKVPIKFVSRAVPYAGWELERLATCAQNGGTRNKICEDESVTVFPVAGGSNSAADQDKVVIGVRFDGMVVQSVLGELGAPVTHDDGCVESQTVDRERALFKALWGSNLYQTVSVRKEGYFCVMTVPGSPTGGPSFGVGDLLSYGGLAGGGGLGTVVMARYGYGDSKVFTRTAMARISECMMYSVGVISNNEDIVAQFRSLCERDPTVNVKSATLSVPAATGAKVAKAVGRCESPGSSTAHVSKASDPATAADGTLEFTFDDICPDFVGLFSAGVDDASQRSEICTSAADGSSLITAGPDISGCTSRNNMFRHPPMGSGLCVNRPVAVKLDPPFSTQAVGNAQRTVFDVIGLPNEPVTPVEQTTVEVQCADMYPDYDIQYYVRSAVVGTKQLGITYGSPDDAETAERVGLNAGEAVSFGAIDFDTPDRGYHSLRLTIDTLDTDEFEVFVCTRTSRDLSRVTGDVDIAFGRCEDRFVVTYEGWPSGAGPIELDLSVGGGVHTGRSEVSGVSFFLDAGEKLSTVVAKAGTAGSGRREFETVPYPCRDQSGGPHARRLVTERLMTTYTFEPGVCPEEDLLRFCSDGAGGGAWALPGATVVAGTRDGPADGPAPYVSVGAAGLDWRTVPVETIAECHALCVQLAEAAAGTDTGTASVCALLHWKPPSLDTYGRCSMLVGAPYHPNVVGTPDGYTAGSAVRFDSAFLARTSSTDTDYLVLCPGRTGPADPSSDDAPEAPAEPVCPDGFLVQPGDQTDEEPVCIQLQCPSDMFANPSQEVRPFFPRGPHCGPKEERVSQRYPVVAPAGTPTTVETIFVGAGEHDTEVTGPESVIGPLDMHLVEAGEKIRITYADVSVDMSHLPASSPRASLKALRINVPNAVFLPSDTIAYPSDPVVPNEAELGHCTCAVEDYTIPAAPTDVPTATRAPDLPTQRTVVRCTRQEPQGFSTTTLAPGETHPCKDDPLADGCVQYLPRTTLRVYAKVTVTLGTTELATDKVVEFEPLLNLEAAKVLFNDNEGTINDFGHATADGVFKLETDLAHTIYLDLRDSDGVSVGSEAEDLVVDISDICAVRRNFNLNGDYPEPDAIQYPPDGAGDTNFWSAAGPCGEFQTIIVPSYGLTGSVVGADNEVDDEVCGAPDLIDAYLVSLEPLSALPSGGPTHHGLYADFEWCRPVDLLPHGCTTLTLCSPETHYEAVPPTATSDRGCVAITRCNADTHYESAAPTPTTDRACTERTRCDLNVTFYRTGGTDTSDTVCEYRGTCATGTEFHANTAAATTDTECVEITQCADDGTEYESASHTVATDRECTTVSEECPVGTAFKSAEASPTTDRACTPLSVCISGEAEGTAPTATADRQCVPVEEPAPPPDATAERTLPEWSVWTISGAAAAALVVAVAVFGD